MNMNIQMVDLKKQYHRMKNDIDSAIVQVLENTRFVKGPNNTLFEEELARFVNCLKAISCANGTDALQIALMALDLKPGDEVIVPAFTYVATAEVIGLLGLTPVLVDVNPDTFNIDPSKIMEAISEKTKLIVPVHLFGQCANMDSILSISQTHNLFVVEDTAQAIGSHYQLKNGETKSAGCIGDIGTTSFFPSKNLGCFGDGGALFTNDETLGKKIKMIANHGQSVQYSHEIIGVNSRLDELQAAILRVKLNNLSNFNEIRNEVAEFYDGHLSQIPYIQIPIRDSKSTHVFHQYTIKVKDGLRDDLKKYLQEKSIPSMIYYPKPLHHQEAFKDISKIIGNLEISTQLCSEVLSLPIHTEMESEQMDYIVSCIQEFFNGK